MSSKTIDPKTQLLLAAALDVLHFESKEWQETIAFWKDEVKFFDVLLKRKELSKTHNLEYQYMLKSMDKIHTDLFNDLEKSIVEHEKLLSQILLGKNGMSDNDYREKHRHLFIRMETFTSSFKTFKKVVFDYSKGL